MEYGDSLEVIGFTVLLSCIKGDGNITSFWSSR